MPLREVLEEGPEMAEVVNARAFGFFKGGVRRNNKGAKPLFGRLAPAPSVGRLR